MGRVEVTKRSNFYKNFRETNPALLLGLIIITFGFFIINWIYSKNKEFTEIDENAPDPNRGAIIMMVLPFIWFFIISVFKNILFKSYTYILKFIEITGWILVVLLIMNYLFDFCVSFANITKTNHYIWFSFFLLPAIGIICIFIKIYFMLFLVFFLFIGIPAMQAELNSYIKKFNMKKNDNLFYN